MDGRFRDVGKYSFFLGGEDEIWDEDDLFVVSFLGSFFDMVLEDDFLFWDLFSMALLEFFGCLENGWLTLTNSPLRTMVGKGFGGSFGLFRNAYL